MGTDVNCPDKKNDEIEGSGPQLYKVLIFDDYLFERVPTKVYPDHDHQTKELPVMMSENQDEVLVEIADTNEEDEECKRVQGCSLAERLNFFL